MDSVASVVSMRFTFTTLLAMLPVISCVPSGSAPPWDGGTRAVAKAVTQAPDILTNVFEDSFDDRKDLSADASPPGLVPQVLASKTDAGTTAIDAGTLLRLLPDAARAPDSAAALPPLMPQASNLPVAIESASNLGPNWRQSKTSAWKIENGRLCGKGARNHGVWLTKPIPVNARIEFDAIASSASGDLKAEVWGDGQSSATSVSYTNATSYLAILGGWENTVHVLARVNEHGGDRKEIKVDKDSDDSRQHPVSVGQAYRFKIERSDGKTVRVSVNGAEYFSWTDTDPLAGLGHDHFGFNNWEVKTCFDNVKVTPL
jgi:hypothetical protein